MFWNQKYSKILIKISIINLILFLFLSADITIAKELFNSKDLCKSEKGVWREFGNDCADFCSLERSSGGSCASKITYSCDCLKNRCWDDYRCINNKSYQKEAKKKEQERLEKLKKSNPELFNYSSRNETVKINKKNKNSDDDTESGIKRNEDELKDERNYCISSRGIWKKFPDACSDRCEAKSGPTVCASVITDSCDCGNNRCWNGESCILSSK